MSTEDMLQCLGITGNYKGYYHAAYAVTVSLEEPQSLLMPSKWLYPTVASHYGTTASCVERNIRTVATMAWKNQRTVLEQYARHSLPGCPTASTFIAILSMAARR